MHNTSSCTLDQASKLFYDRFKVERAAFLAQIQSLEKEAEESRHEPYASLLLHRLLFLYFLQKKGLLDGDTNYFSSRLCMMRTQIGQDMFYHHFLLRLFHEGPGTSDSCNRLHTLPGQVPYLDGDLFTTHSHEKLAYTLHIPDAAFTRLFAFFDTYTWYPDDRPLRQKNEINPAILGYVFEQYVNQQQMGAYYTREDVTGYIASNTIIPYLLDAVAKTCKETLTPLELPWQSLQAAPDRYIPPALKNAAHLQDETPDEYTTRRAHYAALCAKIAAGVVCSIDDLITYNLDICQFAQDAICHIKHPVLLRIYYKHLQQMTILDPTCGSGAFLLAALNILAPLYELCLARMQAMTHEADFRATLAEVQQQPTRRYFILTSIIMHNLYGVDIMEEACEICKLRLFLKLIAELEYDKRCPALPNIVEHIRAGNALSAMSDDPVTVVAGSDARKALSFNWHNAFHEIFKQGGFNVIIGNPPYVEYSEKTFPYTLKDFTTLPCANLYPYVVERSRALLSHRGRHGMVVPLAAFATRNMVPFLKGFRRWFPTSWLSFYHFRPAMLFSGGKVASIPTAIYLAKTEGPEQRFSTHLLKWSQEQRPQLFSRLAYCQVSVPLDSDNPHYYPKFGHHLENAIMSKLLSHTLISRYLAQRPNDNVMYYRSAGGLYWKVFVNFAWPYQTTSNKQCFFQADYERDIFVALFNSSLFWWYYTVTFDTFNVKDYMLFGFRFSYPQDPALRDTLTILCRQLMTDYQKHAQHLTRGTTGSYTIYARKSKTIIDEIDRVLAQHYAFTDEEVHFILNYDRKYRLGQEVNMGK